MHNSSWLAVVLCVWPGASILSGQERQQTKQPLFRTETALIEVEVRATDRRGAIATDLEKEDFTLFENGEEQEIATFEFVPSIRAPARANAGGAVTGLSESRDAGGTPREETLIYIASRVGEQQRIETHRAISEFVEANLRPGVRVSLEGLPFTSNKQALLATLDKMLGQGGKDGIPGFVHAPTASIDEQVATITAFTGVTSPVHLSTPVSMAHTQRVHFERTLIEGYRSLVNRLSVYPGKKILVLFCRGMRFDSENAVYMDRFAAEAMRARVTLYAVDVRGLVAMVPGGDARTSSQGQEGGSGERGLPWPPRPELADKPFSADDLRFSQQGLMSLAEVTGGKAVVNSNDLGAVFDSVNEDLGDYYLLGYYPRDRSEQGRFRKIRVEIDRPGVKLSFRDGYFEGNAFSELTKGEKRRALERLLYSNSMPREIPLQVRHEFFRGEDRRPLAAYCVGIKAQLLPATLTKKGLEVDLAMVVLAESVGADRVPFRDDQSLHLVFQPEEFQRMQADSTAMVQFPSALSLPAGRYRWKVVVRDEGSGKAGAFQSIVEVPEFSGALAPSSLLLTGRMVRINTAGDSGEDSETPRGIDAEQMRFYPHPANVFRRGQPIYMVYDLYNVSPELLEAAPGPRAFLQLDGEVLDSPPFQGYQAIPSEDRGEIRYVSKLLTNDLRPGSYSLAIALPGGESAIYNGFELVDFGE